MYNTTYLREQLDIRDANRHEAEARHARLVSHQQARDTIETRKACGKPTTAMEFTLRYAERNGLTYHGAESALIASGQLQAYLNDRG